MLKANNTTAVVVWLLSGMLITGSAFAADSTTLAPAYARMSDTAMGGFQAKVVRTVVVDAKATGEYRRYVAIDVSGGKAINVQEHCSRHEDDNSFADYLYTEKFDPSNDYSNEAVLGRIRLCSDIREGNVNNRLAIQQEGTGLHFLNPDLVPGQINRSESVAQCSSGRCIYLRLVRDNARYVFTVLR